MTDERSRIRITIRAAVREQVDSEDPRRRFWRLVKNKEQWSQTAIEVLEQALIARFGSELHSALLKPVTERLSSIRYEAFGHDLERYFHFPDRRYYGDLTGILERRDAHLFSIPEYQQLMRRAVLGASLTFAVEILG